MRHLFLTLFLSLLLSGLSSAWAQGVHFKFGPIGGINSTVVQTNIPNFNNQASANFNQASENGYFFGAFGRLEIGRVYIQPEAMFNSKLSAISGDINSGGNYNVKFNFTAYDLNLLLGYDFAKVREIANFRGFAGVGESFLTNTTLTANGLNLPSPNLNNGSANGIVGIGFDLLKFTADLRVEHSFSDLYTGSSKVSATVFMLTVGLKFL